MVPGVIGSWCEMTDELYIITVKLRKEMASPFGAIMYIGGSNHEQRKHKF